MESYYFPHTSFVRLFQHFVSRSVHLHKEFWITVFITTVLTILYLLPLLFMPMLFMAFWFMGLVRSMVPRLFHLWWSWGYNGQLWYLLRNFLYPTEKVHYTHTPIQNTHLIIHMKINCRSHTTPVTYSLKFPKIINVLPLRVSVTPHCTLQQTVHLLTVAIFSSISLSPPAGLQPLHTVISFGWPRYLSHCLMACNLTVHSKLHMEFTKWQSILSLLTFNWNFFIPFLWFVV
jgi:hypothetical protein